MAQTNEGLILLAPRRAILDLREFGSAYTLVATGLILFGTFSLIVARYRIIPEIGAHNSVAWMAWQIA